MSLTPDQLAILEAALRKKWEAEKELEEVRAELMGDFKMDVLPTEMKRKDSKNSRAPKSKEDKSVASRIITLFNSLDKPTATTAEVVAALNDLHSPTIRVALSRLVKKRKQLRLALDDSGNEQRGVYELVRGDL